MVVSDCYLKKYSHNQIQTWCVHLLGECSEMICILATLANFWPSSGHKITESGGFWPLTEKVFMNSNSNLVCTLIGWCVHLLDECSESICFWTTLAKFCPSSGHKMTENGSVQPLSGKVSAQSNYNLVCTLLWWMLRIDSLLGQVGQTLALWWPQNDWKLWFLISIWKSVIMWNIDYSIYFKYGVHSG